MTTENNRFKRLPVARRRAVILGLCLVLLVVIFLAAEGFVRYRAWVKHGGASIRIEKTYKLDENTGLRILRTEYRSERLTINSFGFRSPEIDREKPADTYRIAFLGGSTTFNFEVSGNANTWPALVVSSLSTPGEIRQFDFINAGVPGYSLGRSRERFEQLVKSFRPDLVVIYHASNDLSGISRRAARKAGVLGNWGDQSLSWVSSWSLLAFLVEKSLQIILRQHSISTGDKLKVDPDTLAEPFGRELRNLVRSVKSSGAKVALVAYATRLQRSMSVSERKAAAAFPLLYYMPYMTPNTLLDSFDAYNRVIRDVAKEENAVLIEAATAIPGDDRHFVDSVHLNDRGSAVMADIVSKSLRQFVNQSNLESNN